MKYLLILIPLLSHGISFLKATKDIQLSGGSISFISIFQDSRCDIIVNLVISLIITLLILRSIKIKSGFKNFFISAIFILYINKLYNLVTYVHISQFFKPIVSSPYFVEGAYNLTPLKNINLIFYSKSTFIHVIGNSLLLSPLAFFIHYYKWSRSYFKTFLSLLGVITFIEFFQLIQTYIGSMYNSNLLRAFDIDDFILNSISVILGLISFIIYKKSKFIKRLSKKLARSK